MSGMGGKDRFGVKLDCTGAGSWLTAGDVDEHLLKALRRVRCAMPDTRRAFAAAVGKDTGVAPRGVGAESFTQSSTG